MSNLIENVSKFGITLIELRNLMGLKGKDGIEQITELGGKLKILKLLQTSEEQGIVGSHKDIENRRKVFGSNLIPAQPPKGFIQLIWEALQDATLVILIVAGLVSLILSFYNPKDQNSKLHLK